MEFNDIIIILIIIFGLALLAVVTYIGVTTYLEKSKEKKEKPIEETSMLNDIEKQVSSDNKVFKSKKIENPNVNQKKPANQAVNKQPKKAQTKEEREKQSNPFGVDMTRRINNSNKSNPNNKFIK